MLTMRNSKKSRVRLPNGKVVTATIGNIAETGFRDATVRVSGGGIKESIKGRVTTRHGQGWPRILPFKVRRNTPNAALVRA